MKNAFTLLAFMVSAAIALPMTAHASSIYDPHRPSRDASLDASPDALDDPLRDPWSALRADFPADHDASAEPAPDAIAVNETLPPALDGEPDWSLLAQPSEAEQVAKATLKATLSVGAFSIPARTRPAISHASAWTSERQNNGTSALSVNRPLTAFWDARVGADMNVTSAAPVASASDMLLRRFGTEQTTSQSGGSAWVRMTAPGSNIMWDKAEIEARLDPAGEQNRWGTVFSKSVPVGSPNYALTLQNNVNVIQHGTALPMGFSGSTVEADQLARFSWKDSGTSLIAGQTHSTATDKWLRRIGAEQKVFGNLKLSGSFSETANGATDKALFATYSQKW